MIVVYDRPTLDRAESALVDSASAVLYLEVFATPTAGVIVARVHVLRSAHGDPFATDVTIDLRHVDPGRIAEREKAKADEISAALATLEKYGALIPPIETGGAL